MEQATTRQSKAEPIEFKASWDSRAANVALQNGHGTMRSSKHGNASHVLTRDWLAALVALAISATSGGWPEAVAAAKLSKNESMS